MGGYAVGVDLGTTWTAAAIQRRGSEPQMLALGGRSAAVPTVVHLPADGPPNVGDAAVRRALTETARIAREFKRRVGDTAPVLVGGQPWSPEALLAVVLQWVLVRATEVEGEGPSSVVVTHPANWGPLRLELFEQAVAHAGVTARLVTEPEAAALHYASAARVPDGTVVAVYDLGGGTFDATVLRKDPDGFRLLGGPEGVERLGGLDIDAAVLGHVAGLVGSAWSELDTGDPASLAAAARLRQSCVDAKEALSEDPDVVIPVVLPAVTTEVRLTRSELEAMIRPAIERSADALERAIAGAGLTTEQIDRILLVGGSSRIPLVSQVLAARFGRPLALDAHPKHAVALGAARLAAELLPTELRWPGAGSGAGATTPPPSPPPSPPAPAPPTPPPSPPEVPVLPEVGVADEPARRRPPWVPVAAVVAAVAVVGIATLLVTRGGDGDGDGSPLGFDRVEPGAEGLLEASDATGTIAVEVPERWSSVGGLPIGFDDSDVVAPDLVVSTDEERFQEELPVPGVNIRWFDAAAIEEFGVLGDAAGLVGPEVEFFDLPGVCAGDTDEPDVEIAGYSGDRRRFEDCGGAQSVEVFGGFNDDGDGLIVIIRAVDDDDEAVLDDVLASIALTPSADSVPSPRDEVVVQVVNASAVAGAAGTASDALEEAGFATLDPADDGPAEAASTVLATPGAELDAVAVATVLGFGVEPVGDALPPGASADAHVIVVLGSDDAG